MIDTTLVPFAIAFVAFAAVVAVASATAIVIAVRQLRSTPGPVVVSVAGPQRELSRVA